MGIVRRFEFDGVEGLQVGRYDLGLNTSAVLYRWGSVVIDSGPPNRWPPIRDFLEQRPPGTLLLTHHHEDHSGNAARIQSHTGARVLAHLRALPHLAAGWPLAPYQRLIWGRPATLQAEALPAGVDSEGGGQLRPVHAPGHSEDMVCYHEPDRGWLFTGDLFISSRPRYLRFDEDLPRLVESLREILELDFQEVFCGHRGVVADGYGAMREKLDYLESLRDEANTLRNAGWTVQRITRRLLGREDVTNIATGCTFSKQSLIRACLKIDES